MVAKLSLVMLGVLVLAANGLAATGSSVAGPKPPPPISKQLKAGRQPYTDDCGNKLTVLVGSVTVHEETIDGKTCWSKITFGKDDTATLDLDPDANPEITINGAATVTINGDNLGEKDAEDPSDSEPGITLVGDAKGKGSVTVNGSGSVIQAGGKNHTISVNGNGNWVLSKGSGHSISMNGNGNTVYT